MNKMRFKIGDKVRIKKNLPRNKYFNRIRLCIDMSRYNGKETKITAISNKNDIECYYLDCDEGYFAWSYDMLESIENTPRIHPLYSDKANIPFAKRKDGFYWVKFNNKWTISEFINKSWSLIGRAYCVFDSFFQEIDENKIIRKND